MSPKEKVGAHLCVRPYFFWVTKNACEIFYSACIFICPSFSLKFYDLYKIRKEMIKLNTPKNNMEHTIKPAPKYKLGPNKTAN
ncbi:MAG: hypothetical protein Greene07142_726 [Parcubacteria group bacterium Greene0714_2]|nr:MAG: hypothetical protein Greene07142_726 [Parcubacteria group bacterium Greene0714_2]